MYPAGYNLKSVRPELSGISYKKDYVSAIAPDKDWKQLGIYPPLFGLTGYFKLGISSFCIGYLSESK